MRHLHFADPLSLLPEWARHLLLRTAFPFVVYCEFIMCNLMLLYVHGFSKDVAACASLQSMCYIYQSLFMTCNEYSTPKNVAAFAGKALAMAGPNPLKSAFIPSLAIVWRAQSIKPV